MIETLVKLMTPALEEKAGKMVTPRLIKRAVTDMLAATNEDEQKPGNA